MRSKLDRLNKKHKFILYFTLMMNFIGMWCTIYVFNKILIDLFDIGLNPVIGIIAALIAIYCMSKHETLIRYITIEDFIMKKNCRSKCLKGESDLE